tara:strand:- start:41 stop:448 length:408 start_codon:yes stop_codon:yes gene_type:complete
MSGEPIEKVDPKAESMAHWATITEQQKAYGKIIQKAKDNIQYNTIEETAYFDDSGGRVGDWYSDVDEIPELKVLCDFVEEVRRRWFLLNGYNRDILYGNSVSVDELQWIIMKTVEEEIFRHIEKRNNGKYDGGLK